MGVSNPSQRLLLCNSFISSRTHSAPGFALEIQLGARDPHLRPLVTWSPDFPGCLGFQKVLLGLIFIDINLLDSAVLQWFQMKRECCKGIHDVIMAHVALWLSHCSIAQEGPFHSCVPASV